MSNESGNHHPQPPFDPERTPERIAHLLTLGAEQLDDATAAALVRARETALTRQHVSAPALAAAGWHWHLPMPHSGRQWMTVLLLALAVAGTGYWRNITHRTETAHLDIALLTDDMPLEVFIDK